jgi:uncharacterized iron-regulated protein
MEELFMENLNEKKIIQKKSEIEKIQKKIEKLETEKTALLEKLKNLKSEKTKLENEKLELEKQDFLDKFFGKLTDGEIELIEKYRNVSERDQASTQRYLQNHALPGTAANFDISIAPVDLYNGEPEQ